MRSTTFLASLGLLAMTSGIGYGFYQQHATKMKLHQQLQQLAEVLTDDNDHAARTAEGTLKGLEAQVIKNQNQPHDLALFAKAKAFAARADSLVRTLQAQREALLRATGNPTVPTDFVLPYPNEAGTVAAQLATSTAHQNLTRQLADYAQARQQLSPRDTGQLTAPTFGNMPVTAALAHLTRLESDVRTTETATLKQLAPRLGAKKLSGRIMAVATAESNIVVPGMVYKAKMYLAKALHGVHPLMTCNGQPVRVGPDGQGLVRFVAPKRPGPAVWLGTIQYNLNGRDTTFQVRMPYRVVRR